MNPDTGHLFRLRRGEAAPESTEALPDDLHLMARLKMDRATKAEQPVQVNLRSSTPLAKWARKKRLEKIRAKSRRINRDRK